MTRFVIATDIVWKLYVYKLEKRPFTTNAYFKWVTEKSSLPDQSIPYDTNIASENNVKNANIDESRTEFSTGTNRVTAH